MAASSTTSFTDLEAFLASNPTPTQIRDRFTPQSLALLKSQLDPAANHSAILELQSMYENDPNHKGSPEVAQGISQQIKALRDTPEHKHFRSIFGALERLMSQTAIRVSGPSNRGIRARSAKEVFTKFAGISNISGERDQYGNSITGLTKSRAYEGMIITVLIYNHELNDFTRARHILENMGFKVRVYDITSKYSTGLNLSYLSEFELDNQLSASSQCWVISGVHSMSTFIGHRMTPSKRDIILKHWHQGMGLYVLGDNVPFIADANFLLKSMYPDIDVRMDHNYKGCKTLHHSLDAVGGHITENLLTTGIINCFSGDTVAEIFNTDKIPGFVEVMFESTGHLTLGYAPANGECGPVVISGAFTTLYFGLDTPGSVRLIENSVGFLSTRMEETPVPVAASSVETTEEPSEFDLTDAMIGEDSISYEEGPLAILLHYPKNSDRNCTDLALNNSLGRPRANAKLLSRNPVIMSSTKLFTTCPFTRRPIGAFSLLDLSS